MVSSGNACQMARRSCFVSEVIYSGEGRAMQMEGSRKLSAIETGRILRSKEETRSTL